MKNKVLKNLSPEQLAKLVGLPGLLVHETSVEGLEDAISAAKLRIGVKVPKRGHASPIEAPHLMPFQRRGVADLLEMTDSVGGALLADQVGLGKTKQAIEFAKFRGGRMMIICPRYVCGVWERELTEARVGYLVKSPNMKRAEVTRWAEECQTTSAIVTSYEMAEQTFQEAFTLRAPNVLLIDEAHYLCGRWSKRTKAVGQIAAEVNYKLALTATPAYNRPRDFYSLLRVLIGNKMGTPSDFDFAYCNGRINDHGGMDNDGISNAEELRHRLGFYMVQRTKQEVLPDLPALTRQTYWVDPDPKAEQAFRVAMGQSTLTKSAYWEALAATLEAKMPTCIELAVQAKQFLLFTWLKKHANSMHRELTKRGVHCMLITGDIAPNARKERIQEAIKNNWGVVATMDAAGAGLDGMQGSISTGIMHSIDYNPNKLVQGEGRLHRMGQTRGVHWVYVAMRDTMDQLVIQTVVEKLDALAKLTAATPMELRSTLQGFENGAGTEGSKLLQLAYEQATDDGDYGDKD